MWDEKNRTVCHLVKDSPQKVPAPQNAFRDFFLTGLVSIITHSIKFGANETIYKKMRLPINLLL